MTCNDNDLSEEDPDLIAGTRLVVITHNWTKCFHLYSLVRFQTVCELEDQLNVRDQLTVRNQLTSRLLLIATGQRASTCNNYCAVSFLLQIHQMELSNSCCTDLLLSPLQIQGMGKCTRFKDFAVCAGNFFMFSPKICRALSCSQNGNFLKLLECIQMVRPIDPFWSKISPPSIPCCNSHTCSQGMNLPCQIFLPSRKWCSM